MNNTTTKRNLVLVAVFMAATLVVGTLATTTATQSAFAYSQKKKGDDNSRNGNTVTIEDCKNKGSASGFDTATNQECENLICTHPGENATCVQEGVRSISTPTSIPTPTPEPTPKTCVECFTSLLTPFQIAVLPILPVNFCAGSVVSEDIFRGMLTGVGVSIATQNELIACLKEAGIVFPSPG